MFQIFERRVRAFSIDTSAVMLVWILISFQVPSNLGTWIIFGVYVLVFIFPLFFWNGQTMGKRFQKIKIVKIDGRDAGLMIILAREILKMTLVIFTFGLYTLVGSMMISKNGQTGTLHDRIFKTKIISTVVQSFEEKDDYLSKTPSMKGRGL